MIGPNDLPQQDVEGPSDRPGRGEADSAEQTARPDRRPVQDRIEPIADDNGHDSAEGPVGQDGAGAPTDAAQSDLLDQLGQLGRLERPAEDAGPTGGAEPTGDAAPAGDADSTDGTPDWDPTGLELARSVVGSLVNRGGPAARRGSSGAGGDGPSGRASARKAGPRSRAASDSGQAAYADIAGRSGAHPDDRDPQALDNTIDRLVADRGWNTDVAVAGALSRWDQIVGPQIAEHCRAERYADGVLTVRADSTAWATQVRLLAASLVKRLNEDLGDGTVVRIVVQGPTGHDWRKGGVGTRDARGPRDTFG